MNGIEKTFRVGLIAFSVEPNVNKHKLIELPVGALIEYKNRVMEVVENNKPLSCEGCTMKEVYVGSQCFICDGLACFKTYRSDNKNVYLKFCNQNMNTKIKGGGHQQELAL